MGRWRSSPVPFHWKGQGYGKSSQRLLAEAIAMSDKPQVETPSAARPPRHSAMERLLEFVDDRTGLVSALAEIAKHPVPPDSGWWYVFGSATLVAFIIQVATGIALATAYITSTGDAYESLNYITYSAIFGNILRGMHYFGASAMVLLVGIHMGQVFLMGAYKYPREFNWITGVGLLVFTLAMGFTGQLLRWDQNAVWSVMLAAEMASRAPFVGPTIARFILAGNTLGGATLSRFFAFHVFFIPAIIFVFIGVHLYLVLHDGISEPPVPGRPVDPKTYKSWYHNHLDKQGVPFWPDALWRDAIFATLVVVIIAGLALIFGPPHLDPPPNPSVLLANPRPDWYFLWIFALLALMPPVLENYFFTAAPVIVGIILLGLPIFFNKGERSASRRPWAPAIVIIVVVSIGSFWMLGVRSPWSPDFEAKQLPESAVGVASGPIANGAKLFYDHGCEYCHFVDGHGGHRGPDLSDIGDRLTEADIIIRINVGAKNMPAFASTLSAGDVSDLTAFLLSRRHNPPAPVVTPLQAAAGYPSN